jgi:ferrous iron transport protein B
MELPPYRLPHVRDVWRQTWERTSGFIREAGTIILATSVIIWVLMAIPVRGEGGFNDVEPKDSLFGTVSDFASPIFTPAGFGDWQATGSLITGLVAKEVVIGTMSQIYVGEADSPEAEETSPTPTFGEDVVGIGQSFIEASVLTAQEVVNIIPRTLNILPFVHMPEADFLGRADEPEDTTALENSLTQIFTPLSAVAFTVFVLLYTPCMATVGAMRHEFGTRFTIYQVLYTFGVAWLMATIVYQIGSLIGWGG